MAIAIPRGVIAANIYSLLPRVLQSSTFTAAHAVKATAVTWSWVLPSASITIPAITLNIPGVVSDIWEGILRAVPKKKTSHMKKRHRQLAGKALKDVKSLVRCPACGKPKKAHMLCPYCVAEIGSARIGGRGPRRRATAEDGETEQEDYFNKEGEVEREELKDSKEKTQKDFEVEETDNDKRHAETFKERAGPTGEQRSEIQQARVPGRKRGGWRDELKYL